MATLLRENPAHPDCAEYDVAFNFSLLKDEDLAKHFKNDQRYGRAMWVFGSILRTRATQAPQAWATVVHEPHAALLTGGSGIGSAGYADRGGSSTSS